MNLSLQIYRLTKSFPDAERFGLISQLRRAAVSAPSHLAECHGRGGPKALARFAAIAKGSLCEVETRLLLAAELGFAERSEVDAMRANTDEISRMLAGLIRSAAK